MNLIQLFAKFPNDDTARKWLENVRWSSGRYCGHCGSFDNYHVKNEKPMPYRCRDCGNYFSVRTNTPMQCSNLSLQKWVIAVFLMTSLKKGLSSVQMGEILGCSQPSAWHLMQRIREGWNLDVEPLDGTIEVDEVYLGGKARNKPAKLRPLSKRGPAGKTPVLGALQRDGRVYAEPFDRVSIKTVTEFIQDVVAKRSVVYTDESSLYSQVHKHFYHDSVAHGKGEYVNVDTHTNGIESYWASLRRQLHCYHWVSKKHMARYINECCGRFNLRHQKPLERMETLVRGFNGTTLTYKELIA